MSLVDRAKNILLTPRTEWPRIEAEPATIGGLFTRYAMILAALPALGLVLGMLLFAGAALEYVMGAIIVGALAAYAITLGVVYLMGMIVQALAPSFDGERDAVSAMKLVVYSATALWVAGFFSQLLMHASWALGSLINLAGFAYAAWLIYLGSIRTVRIPEDKAVGFTVVITIIWFVVALIVALVLGELIASSVGGGAMVGSPDYR